MAGQVQEVKRRVVYDDGRTEEVVKRTDSDVVETDTAHVDSSTTIARVVWYITGALVVVLAMRFGLSLLGANRGNAFADLIYTISYPFVAPFFGLFGYQVSYGVSRFEIETLIAMVVYLVIGYGLARLVTINRRDRGV